MKTANYLGNLKNVLAVFAFLLVVFTSIAPSVFAVSPEDDYFGNNKAAATALQGWYSTTNGLWSNNWWQSANALEEIENTYDKSNGQLYSTVISNTYSKNSSGGFINHYYDDEGWWGNAWVHAYQLTGNTTYLTTAKNIFTDMKTGWDSTCGGGIWWNKDRTYKNAIPNELFLLLAIRLHQQTPGDSGAGSYIDWANQEWTWFNNSGLINSQNLINDGLDSSCQNNNGTTWTYNQGVILSGLTDLYTETGDTTYLTKAQSIASAAISTLVNTNGILTEPCEATNSCGGDGSLFKGIFMRNLSYLNTASPRSDYRNFLVANAKSIWANDRNGSNQLGLVWSGPFDSADPVRQTSAMFPLSALSIPSTAVLPFVSGSADPSFGHSIGYQTGVASWTCDSTVCNTADFMQWGPYVTYLPTGTNTIHFRLSSNAVSSSNANLLTVDVRENVNGTTLATKNIPWSTFTEANKSKDISMTYSNSNPNAQLEFRAYWNNVPGAPAVTLSDVSVNGGTLNWDASNVAHSLGRVDSLFNWSADPRLDTSSDYLASGATTKELTNGKYSATFELKVNNFKLDSSKLATISVREVETNRIVATQDIFRNNFTTTLFTPFKLNFNTSNGRTYEFRTYWYSFPTAPVMTLRSIYVGK